MFVIGPASAGFGQQVTILVNPGSFKDIATAAESEEKVNFWDDELSDVQRQV